MRRCLLSLLVIAACASAQEFRGTLMGRVTDPSGLPVPSAKVIVLKTDTNTRTETVSGPEGNYTAPLLAPGSYEVAAEATGFKKSIRKELVLQIGSRVQVDLHLEVDPEMTVRQSHQLAHQVQLNILARLDWVADVLVHVEPAE